MFNNFYTHIGYELNVSYREMMKLLGYSETDVEIVEKQLRKIDVKYLIKLADIDGFNFATRHYFSDKKNNELLSNKDFLKEYKENCFDDCKVFLNDVCLTSINEYTCSDTDKHHWSYSEVEENIKYYNKDFYLKNKINVDKFLLIYKEIINEHDAFLNKLWNEFFKEIQKQCIYQKSINKRKRPLNIFKDKEHIFDFFSKGKWFNSSYSEINSNNVFVYLDYEYKKELEQLYKTKCYYKIFEYSDIVFVIYYSVKENNVLYTLAFTNEKTKQELYQ